MVKFLSKLQSNNGKGKLQNDVLSNPSLLIFFARDGRAQDKTFTAGTADCLLPCPRYPTPSFFGGHLIWRMFFFARMSAEIAIRM